MWKYLSSDQEKDFLLSLHLIDGKNASEIIKKIYTIICKIIDRRSLDVKRFVP